MVKFNSKDLQAYEPYVRPTHATMLGARYQAAPADTSGVAADVAKGAAIVVGLALLVHTTGIVKVPLLPKKLYRAVKL